MDLVVAVYRVTNAFPPRETYGLASQIRRAAVSIPANLAEGHCRRRQRAFANHVAIALGSSGELQTCLEIASRLSYLSVEEFRELQQLGNSAGRLLSRLYQALEARGTT